MRLGKLKILECSMMQTRLFSLLATGDLSLARVNENGFTWSYFQVIPVVRNNVSGPPPASLIGKCEISEIHEENTYFRFLQKPQKHATHMMCQFSCKKINACYRLIIEQSLNCKIEQSLQCCFVAEFHRRLVSEFRFWLIYLAKPNNSYLMTCLHIH